MSYLGRLFEYSGLSRKAIHRETKITPTLLNKYMAFKAMPNPRSLYVIFNLFRQNDLDCCERIFIEQYDEITVNERAFYCFYATTGKPLHEALSMSRASVSVWSKNGAIPLSRKQQLMDLFEKSNFADYSVEELIFTQPRDLEAEKFNIPSDFADKKNVPEELRQMLGGYVFETPIYGLLLKKRSVKILIEKSSAFTLYDILCKSESDFYSDGIGQSCMNEVETIHKQYPNEHVTILKYHAQITLMSPASFIRDYLEIYKEEFRQHYEYLNMPYIFFKENETIHDFIRWDRWELLKRYIEDGEYETYECMKSVQSFLCHQLGISRLEIQCTTNPYSENIPLKYADKIKKVKFGSISDTKVDHFLMNFQYLLFEEQEKKELRVRETMTIQVFVDHNFILALNFFAQMHFWVISYAIEKPSETNSRGTKIFNPKGYLNFFKTLSENPENMLLYLQIFQELEKAKKPFKYISLNLKVPREYQYLFGYNSLKETTYLANNYNDLNEVTNTIYIDKDLFESGKVCINGLWDALRIAIIIEDSDALKSLEKLMSIVKETDVSVKWEDILSCYSVWGRMMHDLSIGDEFIAKHIYKKYNIEGYVMRLIFDKAVSIGVLSKTDKIFKLCKTV
jgi:hypothetical protein